jgi:hypothetical protein
MVTVKSKSPIWHLYHTRKAGASLRGMKFPPYLKVYTRQGFIDLKYIVRPNSELIEGDKLIICEGPGGCKKYLPNTALDLSVPRCICNNTPYQMEKTNRAEDARRAATTLAKANNVSTFHAILGATTAAPGSKTTSAPTTRRETCAQATTTLREPGSIPPRASAPAPSSASSPPPTSTRASAATEKDALMRTPSTYPT